MKPTRRLLWFVISAVIFGTLLGGTYGQRVEATTDGAEDSGVQGNLKEFTRVYDLVQHNYADPVDPNKAVYGPETNNNVGAIPGMLRTLDPHSNFFDPRTFAQLREEQEGKYYGVGMTIQNRLNREGKLTTYIVAPIPGSPAFREGLRPGDVIMKVDGGTAAGLNVSQVADLLKGPKGTVVHVTVEREGSDQPMEFTITRDEIKRPSVDNAFMMKPGVAYIHVNGFDETTDDELSKALNELGQKNFKGLILDLRGNPGGLLQEAVDVSDHFLAKDQLIVYHYGRASHEKRYYVTKGNGGNEYPMVVLINRNSASAAEIVTGALQDHDRALVLGEPSFGKGLVQTVYPLSEHAGLALTTARYYTPSGRLIQRDYSDISLYDYYYRSEDAAAPHEQVRLTDGGREVYGGGGITPDVDVPPLKANAVEQKIEDHDAVYSFAKHYLGIHKTIPRDFEVTQEVIEDFDKFMASQNIPVTPAEVQDNVDFVKGRIRIQLVGMIYGEDEAAKIQAQNDPLVGKALDAMPQAAALLAHAKQYVATREQTQPR